MQTMTVHKGDRVTTTAFDVPATGTVERVYDRYSPYGGITAMVRIRLDGPARHYVSVPVHSLDLAIREDDDVGTTIPDGEAF